MSTSYNFTFWMLDPGNPPSSGTRLNPVIRNVVDANSNGILQPHTGDTINGHQITAVYVGDTVTMREGPNIFGIIFGNTYTVTGVTFYLSNGSAVFMPTDGSTLANHYFISSTWVPDSTEYPIPGAVIPCFTPGTLIATPEGPRPVEALAPGDMVLTRDNGPQPVRWAGRRAVGGRGDHAPVRFAPGAIGNDRELVVSPQHRVLVEGWRAELLFGADEVLVAARHLVNGDTIHRAPRDRADYIHILFDRHEIVTAEGVATESFHPGDYVLAGDAAIRAELTTLFPELAAPGRGWDTARPVLRRAEAALLAA